MSDIGPKLDKAQYGNRKGSSTEHLLVNLMDKILKMLDANKSSAVIASMVDWASAFDRQDPTLGILKFIQLGVRPALIPILISYLSDRTMKVKFNSKISETIMRVHQRTLSDPPQIGPAYTHQQNIEFRTHRTL